MRLWTVHPRYLDSKGLVALWRESLLAQKVLSGATRGYTNHPQLIRFRQTGDPPAAIGSYLQEIKKEADRRNYNFNETKINCSRKSNPIEETSGQLNYEWRHLMKKLKKRAPQLYKEQQNVPDPQPHPLFKIVNGKIRSWEKV